MDEKEQVLNFLKNEGFPLEMYVASQLRLCGFEVYQGTLYKDQETGKLRELDVTAHFFRQIDQFKSLEIKFIIECKHAKTPWILFGGENDGFNQLTSEYFYCCNDTGKKVFNIINNSAEEYLLGSTVFKVDKFIGYGITELNTKSDKKDSIPNSYKAISTLINSLRSEQETEKKTTSSAALSKRYIVYVPMIVMEGSLYKTEYLGSEQIEARKIDEAQLLYKSNVYEGVFPLIEICTKEKVEKLFKKIYIDCEKIYEELKNC